jgi:ATP-dependent Lon protease
MSDVSVSTVPLSAVPVASGEDVLIILPVRNVVLFPGTVAPVAIGREQSMAAVEEALRTGRKVGVLLQRDPEVDDPAPADLYDVGTVASVLRSVKAQDGRLHLAVRGERRFHVLGFQPGLPFLLARVSYLSETDATDAELEARVLQLKRLAQEAIGLLPQAPAGLAGLVEQMDSPASLADLIASVLDLKATEKQTLLETVELRTRLERVATFLARRIEVLKLSQRIDEKTRESLDGRQREALLREQLKTIRQELGEGGAEGGGVQELRELIKQSGMPEDLAQQALKEVDRLERTPEQSGEHSMQRSYLEFMTSLPWSKLDQEDIDVERARAVLEADHYGLERVKRRILEFLAVRKLNAGGRSPIICLVGPPGVGKTSLGQSIARAAGLKFQRVSLGGVHDEAEIRGHRRTYIGALPGSILSAIGKAGTRNPVLMLDEIDKLGHGFHGDPAAALLEVLDPEQNGTFRDTYLGMPFDLSKVLFIATANILDTIPGPLRDRMEIIEIGGYTEEEKLAIASRYLVNRQLAANGLKEGQIELGEETLRRLARDYTREAGCRSLEREIGAVLRNAAVKIASGATERIEVRPEDLRAILGQARYEDEVMARLVVPGVATGLAWTPVGGDILFIEAAAVPGTGQLILTGQLGDVMKESARAAVSLLKAHAQSLGVLPERFASSDIHIHVPAGAIPKDGPSAGTAMYVALASLFTGRLVRSDLAMTGEISLRGLVLPVGGIRDKTIAAARAGLSAVILPARNAKDLEELPASVRERLSFHFVETVGEALGLALVGPNDAAGSRSETTTTSAAAVH